jgi:hypothetical protein
MRRITIMMVPQETLRHEKQTSSKGRTLNMRMNCKILIVMSIILTTLTSCVMDYMPLGYSVKNCTKDTLFIDLTILTR